MELLAPGSRRSPARTGRKAGWVRLDRHGFGHDRSWYAERFDRIEGTVSGFASQVLDIAASGQYTPSGLADRLGDVQAAADSAARQPLTLIRAAITSDRQAIDQALAARRPLPPPEMADALLYAQRLAMAQYIDGPNPAPAATIWGALDRAIAVGDAVQAQVLADLLPVLIQPSPGDGSTPVRMVEMQQRAARLSATPEFRAALDLKDLLDGSFDVSPGVEQKADFVNVALGGRLSLIVQRAGPVAARQGIGSTFPGDRIDPLAGVFALNFPLPPGTNTSTPMSPASLAQAFSAWFTVVT